MFRHHSPMVGVEHFTSFDMFDAYIYVYINVLWHLHHCVAHYEE